MSRRSYLSTSIRRTLAVSIGLGMLSTSTAFAQEEAVEEQGLQERTERIQVTGSRIARPELSQAAPVVSIGREELANFGTPDLGQILAELPAIGATATLIGNRESNASAGVSSADLRRLGASRTLVLVNGKRHVAGNPGSAQVDLSTIPSAMIERVEIMTGGASAIYGSDAVSGVINVITRTDYEGVEASIRGATSTEGVGARTHEFTLVAGGDFMNGRGNATFNLGMNRIQETMTSDIRQFDNWGSILNPDDTGRLDGIPDRIYAPGVGTEYLSGYGVIPVGPFFGFLPDGGWREQPVRAGENSALFGWFPDGCDTCGYPDDWVNYQPGVNRVTAGSMFGFDVNDNTRLYADFKYVEADVTQQYQPMFDQGMQINVDDNPYLPEDLRAIFQDAGLESVPLWKWFDDWGPRTAENRRQTFRTVLGMEGVLDLNRSFMQYDIYYGYGETRNSRTTKNEIIRNAAGVSNVNAAIDTIRNEDGTIVCRDPDAGLVNSGGECVPYNPFGSNVTPEALAFISHDSNRQDEITQEYVGASFVTDSANFFELQGGPIDVAFGVEWRKETSATTTDAFTKAGLSGSAATPDSYGQYEVTEGFIEINLPLIAGLTGIEELTMDLAYRGADYSHAGSADAWKVGFMYAPVEDIRLRGTFGRAVRAPNVTEAFSPISPGFVNVTDPCDQNRQDMNPNRAANCAALGIPADFGSVTNASIDLISGGNPNLGVETSDSWTAGIVWTPSFVEGLSVTLDIYDIQIEDAITFIQPQDVINNCVDSEGGLSTEYCSQVTRGDDLQLTAVTSGYLNAAAIETRGIELDANYRTDLARWDLQGSWASSLFINYLDKWVRYDFQEQPELDNVNDGQVGDPSWQFRWSNTYRLNAWSANWTMRYIDRSALYNVTPRLESYENVGPAYVGSMTTHDLSATYYWGDNLTINAGVRNILDKVPPGYVTNPLYDMVGRRIFAGVTYSF